MNVLIVQEPHLTKLLNGTKTWEIRRQKTNIRGLIGLGRNRKMYGKAILKDCFPMALENLAKHEDKHCVSYRWLKAYAREKRGLSEMPQRQKLLRRGGSEKAITAKLIYLLKPESYKKV